VAAFAGGTPHFPRQRLGFARKSCSSALSGVAHARVYRFNTLDRRVFLQALSLLAVSLVLAIVARYAGLVPAIVLRTVIDVAGLYTIGRVAGKGLAA